MTCDAGPWSCDPEGIIQMPSLADPSSQLFLSLRTSNVSLMRVRYDADRDYVAVAAKYAGITVVLKLRRVPTPPPDETNEPPTILPTPEPPLLGNSTTQTPNIPIETPAPFIETPPSELDEEIRRLSGISNEFEREESTIAWLRSVPRALNLEQALTITRLFTVALCLNPVIVALSSALVDATQIEDVMDVMVSSEFIRGQLRAEFCCAHRGGAQSLRE
eukprot:c16709_g1_i1.p1 GENE.c16709_g1_i1~~c16709_g1_i1.p1  ORF type:complete len:219 (-),score=37.23 c16709_g1_i1:17-673(-)